MRATTPLLRTSAYQLPARQAGWVCLGCGYTQDWCHAFSAKPFAVKKRSQLV